MVRASEASDFAYAKWYGSLPNKRKTQFFQSAYDLVVEKIKSDVKKDNPVATHAEITLRFIELNHKDSLSPEVMAFIREKMLERAEEEWKQRFGAMKKDLGWTYDQMATYMGAASGNALKASISRQLPAFAKLAVCVFEQLKGRVKVEKKDE